MLIVTKIKTFLLKHKLTILFWIVFSAIVVYLAPLQSDYYLDEDIKSFKRQYLIPILVWTGVVTSTILLVILFISIKSIKQSLLSFLYCSIMIAFFLFIFQDLFLAAALLLNRQFKRDSITKTYVTKYMIDTEPSKKYLYSFDISTGQISIDGKLINKLYYPGLKQNDTVILKFDKGLFGIEYLP